MGSGDSKPEDFDAVLTQYRDADVAKLRTLVETLTCQKKRMRSVDFEEVVGVLGVHPNAAALLFEMFDKDKNKQLDAKEIAMLAAFVLYGDARDKLAMTFSVLDTDGSGTIEREELRSFIRTARDTRARLESRELPRHHVSSGINAEYFFFFFFFFFFVFFFFFFFSTKKKIN
eukprot:TRINITY_DN772_c0_g1_i6.p2 TRINITY_DN772_c0_g1~~TRINITY_DN772_c0_g1_i6.p2  ORF type:complete len:173 (+),score=96.04 TRINITY_DN772_c0_g1_i6:60-578(+)